MKLLITGASGFLGKYVVATALRQKYRVCAIMRPTTVVQDLAWHHHPNVEIVRLDLCNRDGLVDALQGVDVVIHLAAAKTGNFDTQHADTVTATQNLLDAMAEAGIHRLIAISTFSVYDYLNLSVGATLDENVPIERHSAQRDVYTQTKLIQESLIRDFETHHQNAQVTILRPGMVYGRDNLWHALLGIKVSNQFWVRIGSNTQLPLTYVENCAEAIVSVVQADRTIAQTVNIVDDDLPTQGDYVKKVVKHTGSSPKSILIHWTVLNYTSQLLNFCNQRLLQNRVKLPGIFIPARLHARFKPLSYSNQCAKQLLGFQPSYSLETAIQRSCSSAELLDCASLDAISKVEAANLENPKAQ